MTKSVWAIKIRCPRLLQVFTLKCQGQINFVNVCHGPNANSVVGVEVKAGVLPAWKYVQIWDSLVRLLFYGSFYILSCP